jgi:hypothetical protein
MVKFNFFYITFYFDELVIMDDEIFVLSFQLHWFKLEIIYFHVHKCAFYFQNYVAAYFLKVNLDKIYFLSIEEPFCLANSCHFFLNLIENMSVFLVNSMLACNKTEPENHVNFVHTSVLLDVWRMNVSPFRAELDVQPMQ